MVFLCGSCGGVFTVLAGFIGVCDGFIHRWFTVKLTGVCDKYNVQFYFLINT